jgi:peptidoglycan/xylan/chitin deacetylase (PgdA/CDA1 family)
MISVVAREQEHATVREFFELFKTPWMFYSGDDACDVLLCAGLEPPNSRARLVLVYSGQPGRMDKENKLQTRLQSRNRIFSYSGGQIPVYGKALTFGGSAECALKDERSQEPGAVTVVARGQTLVRVGYDLFEEIQVLLSKGQPPAQATLPAIERHIDLLRSLILGNSIPLIEIPPIPEGYNFIACLTHDVDHFGLRNHKFDHTMFGFLYRASIGSVLEVCRSRKSLRQLGTNWAAAVSLPLVHLGIVNDFWGSFDRYLEIEDGLPSTFFVISEKDEPGRDVNGRLMAKRAARYDIAALGADLQKLKTAGHEIAVHGIDAWRDSVRGRAELERISRVTGDGATGVRMHWLYFDENSPRILEQAGFAYDSSIGYNETVGYRAGTTQVFKPFQTRQLLELPLHVMDTALFYPSYLNLSSRQAEAMVWGLVENAIRYGGVLTVNWHDRSIAPERLWDEVYISLLAALKSSGAWFASAAQAVAWFRARRAASFESISEGDGKLRIRVASAPAVSLPRLTLRIYQTKGGILEVTDSPIRGNTPICLAA